MTLEKLTRMVFQIVTNDKKVFTVHTEVGDGLTKVVVDESEQDEEPLEPSEDE